VNQYLIDLASSRMPQLVEVMSKEQTLRAEDEAFLPLKRRQLAMQRVTALAHGGGEPSAK